MTSSSESHGWLGRMSGAPLAMGLCGAVLLWLAQPPLMWSLLAWLAPMPWVLLILGQEPVGKLGYAKLWLAGCAYWAAAVYWICLPHPLTPLGLPFLAGYLGCYLPLFVSLSRVGVYRLRLPVWLAAPIAWTGLELVQAHLFSGFLMGALGHTQAWWPEVIQIAEWTGAYGVSFFIVMTAAGLVDGVSGWFVIRSGNVLPVDTRPPRGLFVAALSLALVLFVGHFAQQSAEQRYSANRRPTVALIQGDTRATWEPDVEGARRLKIMQRQVALSREAVAQAESAGRELDLIVWPESMFRTPLATFDGAFSPPSGPNVEQLAAGAAPAHADFAAIGSELGVPLLVGIDRYSYTGPFDVEVTDLAFRVQNSAALISPRGKLVTLYDKMHRVPFGEYIPLFDNMPAMYFLTPLPGGVKPGEGPVAMAIPRGGAVATSFEDASPQPADFLVSPNICYETVIPHVISSQIRQLIDQGTPPDVMVNMTNNAWFWGSSELEMHLACNVFRAVENRTPMVIAANGGLSAAIDSRGHVLQQSQRMTEQVLIAEVPRDPRTAFYTRYGDLFAGVCLSVCGLLAIIGIRSRFARSVDAGQSH